MKRQIIISRPIFLQQLTNWKPLADIPNQSGFEFVGYRNDGAEVVCKVRKVNSGYTVGNVFSQLTSWRELTKDDREAIANAEVL
jgi:hypothetical protein